MLSLEILIVVAQICLSDGNSPQAVAESKRCNEQIISCTQETYRRQIIKDQVGAFNQCHIKYELSK